jgi:hypothetical protein
MSDLAALGISVQRRFLSAAGETTEGTAELTELSFTLPKPLPIRATFGREGLADKLLKIFKKEIQTGEALFDEAVRIKTDTVEATTALLESADIRAVVERVIVNGGSIEIDGAHVKLRIAGAQAADDEVAELFVRTLVGA